MTSSVAGHKQQIVDSSLQSVLRCVIAHGYHAYRTGIHVKRFMVHGQTKVFFGAGVLTLAIEFGCAETTGFSRGKSICCL